MVTFNFVYASRVQLAINIGCNTYFMYKIS